MFNVHLGVVLHMDNHPGNYATNFQVFLKADRYKHFATIVRESRDTEDNYLPSSPLEATPLLLLFALTFSLGLLNN